MRKFLRSWQAKALALVLVLLAALVTSSVVLKGEESWPARLLGYVLTPVQSAQAGVTNAAAEFFDNLVHAGELADENEALESQIAELREQLRDYYNMERENKLYRYYLGLAEAHPDFEFCPAGIVSRTDGDVFGSFVIDKGTLDGVALYDPVVTDGGLVGYVSKIADTYARVTTVLDAGFRAGGTNMRTNDTGVVGGTLTLAADGLCELRYIDRESLMAIGDTVVTTGMTGIFPRDLVVGTIESIGQSAQGVSLTAVVRPTVDVATISQVFVITKFVGQGNSLEEFLASEGTDTSTPAGEASAAGEASVESESETSASEGGTSTESESGTSSESESGASR